MDNNNEIKSTLLGKIWFFGSLIGVVIFSKYSSIMGLILGQLLLVAGIWAITYSKNIFGLIFALIGGAIILICSYYIWGTHLDLNMERISLVLLLLGFIAVPIIMLLSEKGGDKKKLAICTYQVKGKCVDFKERYFGHGSQRRKGYISIYEFDYKNLRYLAEESTFTYFKPKIDMEKEFVINPNNPEEYYFPLSKRNKKLRAILYSASIITALLTLIYLLLYL